MNDPLLVHPSERVLPTLNQDGTRRWLNPKRSPGRYLSARAWVVWTLIGVFVALPWIRIGGRPAIWLNLPDREFTFFGRVFLSTDTTVLMLGMLSIFVAVFLLTALFGRVWCGWGCPQTVYMEFLFRPVERFFQRWTHGSSNSLRKPVAQVAKYTLFLVFSMGLAHTFLAYFVSTYALRGWITQSPFEHPGPFLVMSGTVGLMMFDFSYFREQMCTVICPYARLQSALLDRDSIVVGFDARRGEPRGKGAARELVRLGTTGLSSRRPGTSPHAISSAAPEHSASERSFGDCIDCGACVRTCPTGIDIRDGLQLECIACAQCVDACDAIMDQLGAPRGLVRYSSQRNLEHGTRPRWLRARTLAYPIILLGLIAGLAWVVSGTRGAQIELLRNPGAPFEALSNGSVRSSVRLRVANRNTQDERYAISVDESDVAVVAPLNPLTVAPNETESTTLFVTVPLSSFDANGERQIIIRVETSGGQTYEESFKLLGPMRSAR